MPPPKETRSYKPESEAQGGHESSVAEEEEGGEWRDKKRKQRAVRGERDDRDRSPLASASSSSGALVSTAMAAREPLQWRKLAAEGLDCDYCLLLPRAQADALFRRLEDELKYFKGDLTRIFVYGKWHDIPRQQVSFGDEGLSYKFSGTTVPARPWPPALLPLRDLVRRVAGVHFNFVLVNSENRPRTWKLAHDELPYESLLVSLFTT
ncbi:DNA oxidative demethylase ALKBH2 [Gryllus bimaculatus]|nr:DNA oxidative demethylase ALKBH2 [Gryllus bimaculatus]